MGTNALAQDKVLIDEDVARFYLERSRQADVCNDELKIADMQIANLRSLNALNVAKIDTYKRDSVQYMSIIRANGEMFIQCMNEKNDMEKSYKREIKTHKKITAGAIIVAIITTAAAIFH